MQRFLSAIRINDWWHHLLPPVLAFYFLGLLISASTVGLYDLVTHFASLIALAIPIAALGFFLNDWTDVEEDFKAGKANAVSSIPTVVRVFILVGLLAVLAALLVIYSYTIEVIILTLVQILLLVLYSCKPFRWKRYKETAVVLDALYSSTIPLAIAIILSVGSPDSKVLLLTLLFGFSKGLRNILSHLNSDKHTDWLAGHYTLAHRLQPQAILHMQQGLFIIEAVVFLQICKMASLVLFWCMVILCFFAFLKRRYYNTLQTPRDNNIQQWLSQLNTIYEVWLPLLVVGLVLLERSPEIVLIFIAISLVIFPRSRLLFSELKIMSIQTYFLAYNLFYFFSDLYFLRIKPMYDFGRLLRRRKSAVINKQEVSEKVKEEAPLEQDFSPTIPTI